jgi:hypothetical protein
VIRRSRLPSALASSGAAAAMKADGGSSGITSSENSTAYAVEFHALSTRLNAYSRCRHVHSDSDRMALSAMTRST